MTRRPGLVALAAAAAFLALAFLPLASADHSYSHRYIVWGRVVDANGDPVPGLTADIGYDQGFAANAEGNCANQPGTETDAYGRTETHPTTNQLGEFVFCFHHHSLSRTVPGTGYFRILTPGYENVTQSFTFDPMMRYTYLTVKLPTAQDSANKTSLETLFTIQGRVWTPSGLNPVSVDGIRVYGDTVHNEPISISFTYDKLTSPIVINTTTNNYGDFAVRVNVTERPTTGRATITIANQTFSADVDPANAGVLFIRGEAARPADTFTRNFLIGLGVVAVVVVGGGALWYSSSRAKAARDEREARERSDRKRANK